MDISLHYIKKGSGAPLLLLHGNGESGDYFVHQMDAFAPCFTVYAIDTRGHGQSPRGTAPFTISQFADDLLGFMDGHGLERADISSPTSGPSPLTGRFWSFWEALNKSLHSFGGKFSRQSGHVD